MKIEIWEIWNYYWGLVVKGEEGNYYRSIQNRDGNNWEEISEELYEQLIKHNKNWNPFYLK